mgnify:CR=1 FL=1
MSRRLTPFVLALPIALGGCGIGSSIAGVHDAPAERSDGASITTTRVVATWASASPSSCRLSAPVPMCGDTRMVAPRAVTVTPWLARAAARGAASCGSGSSVTMPACRSRGVSTGTP